MSEIQLSQNIDFLSIAAETIGAESHEVAIDFIEEVIESLEDEDRIETLENAVEFLEDGRGPSALGLVEGVIRELQQNLEQ